MSKERQFKIPTEVIEKLPWVKGRIPYLYTNSGYTINLGVLYELSFEKYSKISDFLKGTEHTIKAKDRIYVLPMCPTPMFKIKEFAKQLDATIVNDIDKATVVLGHNEITSEDYQYSSLLYLSQVNPLNRVVLAKDHIFNFKHLQVKESFKHHYGDPDNLITNPYYCDDKLGEILHYSYRSQYRNYFVVTGLTMDRYNTGQYNRLYATPYTVDLIYQIKLNKLPIVSLQSFNSQCNAPAVLDNELCDTLITMFNGSDDDKTIAMNLLVNASVDSFYYVYKIACDDKAQTFIYNKLKFKAVREFDKKYDFTSLKWSTKSYIMSELRKKNMLDQLTFNKFYPCLKDELVQKIKHQDKTLMDYFEVSISPSSISEQYLNQEENLIAEPNDINS